MRFKKSVEQANNMKGNVWQIRTLFGVYISFHRIYEGLKKIFVYPANKK